MVDVTDGIAAAADGEALSPIRNLGEQLVMLEHFFYDFEGNINREDDNEDDEVMRTMRTMRMGWWHSLILPVTNSRMDTARRRKKKHTEGSCHNLLFIPCLIVNR